MESIRKTWIKKRRKYLFSIKYDYDDNIYGMYSTASWDELPTEIKNDFLLWSGMKKQRKLSTPVEVENPLSDKAKRMKSLAIKSKIEGDFSKYEFYMAEFRKLSKANKNPGMVKKMVWGAERRISAKNFGVLKVNVNNPDIGIMNPKRLPKEFIQRVYPEAKSWVSKKTRQSKNWLKQRGFKSIHDAAMAITSAAWYRKIKKSTKARYEKIRRIRERLEKKTGKAMPYLTNPSNPVSCYIDGEKFPSSAKLIDHYEKAHGLTYNPPSADKAFEKVFENFEVEGAYAGAKVGVKTSKEDIEGAEKFRKWGKEDIAEAEKKLKKNKVHRNFEVEAGIPGKMGVKVKTSKEDVEGAEKFRKWGKEDIAEAEKKMKKGEYDNPAKIKEKYPEAIGWLKKSLVKNKKEGGDGSVFAGNIFEHGKEAISIARKMYKIPGVKFVGVEVVHKGEYADGFRVICSNADSVIRITNLIHAEQQPDEYYIYKLKSGNYHIRIWWD